MAIKFTTGLLTIAAISVIILQGNVECVRQTRPHRASQDCRDHAQRGSQPPNELHRLLRIANLAELAEAKNPEESVEDLQLSPMNRRQLLKLIQTGKLKVVASNEGDDAQEGEENAAQLEEFLQEQEENDDGANEHRSKPKPWRKVQRIVRRQLIKVPKRYLKKFLRQLGLKRQLRATTRSGGFVALPMDAEHLAASSSVQEVGILMREANGQSGENEYFLYQNK